MDKLSLNSDAADRGAGNGWEHISAAFTPGKFALLLGFFLFAAFSQVWIGRETFMFRDFGVLAYPVVHYHHESFWRGELPLWNPLSNCGVPFLAQWGTMVLYPFSLFYLLLPLPWSLNVFCLAHLFLAGLGMYFLARRWVNDPFAAAIAGTAFVFNGVTLSCLIWPNYTVALGWMPWVVILVERAWTEGGRVLIGASFVAGLQLLAGVPELVIITWLLLFGVWMESFVRGAINRRALMLRALGVILLSSCLIAAQILPFLDLLRHSQRGADFGTSKWAMTFWGLGNLVLPLFRCFLTAQGVYFQIGQEFLSSTYLGLTALALALTAVCSVRLPRVWLLAGLGLFGLLLAIGEKGGVFAWVRQAVPLVGFGRYPIKFVLITSFVVPLLAAFAVRPNQGASNRTTEWWWRRLFVISTVLLVVTGGLLWLCRRFPTEYDNWPAIWRCAVWRAVLLAGAVALFRAGLVKEQIPLQRIVAFVVPGILVFDAMTHVPRQNPTLPSSVLAPGIWEMSNGGRPPRHGEGRMMISASAEDRLLMSSVPKLSDDFMGKRLALWSNLNLLESAPKVNGSATLRIREQMKVQSKLYTSTNSEPRGIEEFLGVSQKTSARAVTEWTSRSEYLPLVTAGQRPVFLDDDSALDTLMDPAFDPVEVVYLPRALESEVGVRDSSDAKVLSAKFAPHQIDAEVEAAEPALIVLAQSFYPCWKAYVDGEPVPLWRGNVAFQVLRVPAGRHSVSVVYEDQTFQKGLWVTIAALLGSGLFFVKPFVKSFRFGRRAPAIGGLLIASLLTGSGCGRNPDGKSQIVLRAVTNNTVDSGHYAGLEIFKHLVESRTEGVIQVELYSDGVLGDEEEMVEGMEMGTVHAMMAAAAKYANFVPEMDLYSVPYTFESWEHFKAVMRSEVDERIRKAVKDRTGDFYLGCFTDGVRNVFTRKPVRTLDELRGIKLRTMTGPNEVLSWKALGTNPTPLAYTELYAALQTGVVDGAENTMTSLLTMKFHESCKYVLRTGHCFLALPFFISEKALEKVPEPLRDVVLKAGADACAEQVDRAILLNRRNETVLREKYGVRVFELAAEDAETARRLCEPVLLKNAARIGMEEEWARIREIGRSIEQGAPDGAAGIPGALEREENFRERRPTL